MNRFVCIHGHFYQPPRENPWIEAVEGQDSARPYPDWNQRITVECYAPNAVARILDDRGRIIKMVNNYARISFNFGPTLLTWMESEAPEVYQAVLAADRESNRCFSGHGSALAQVYNHVIMPLANRRDKETQVLWGLRDFEHRFGRAPEGMWLAETAVDLESLDLMAAHGIRYTILAPHQAARIRLAGGEEWEDVTQATLDVRRPYVCALPSGRRINLFFYHGEASRAVAFECLLEKGEYLTERLLGAFDERDDSPQLVHIATDGETYGHHHRHGEMALAFALESIERGNRARLTNYGEYLEKFPPQDEVEIHEATAWSCAHGVERWRGDCGCHTGGPPNWNQAWRGPLREAFDHLRDTLEAPCEQLLSELLRDPWEARDDYISVILDRSAANVERFFERHAPRFLSPSERVTVLKGLELQRNAMLMYTSCGWFFDEISGVEGVQVMRYAGRLIQLARELFDRDPEPGFLERLAAARSNLKHHPDGARIYQRVVGPAVVEPPRIAAQYALDSVLEGNSDPASVDCYQTESLARREWLCGATHLVAGRVRVTSRITLESTDLIHAVLDCGDLNLSGGAFADADPARYEQLCGRLAKAVTDADLPQIIRILDRAFKCYGLSLNSLTRDGQTRAVSRWLQSTLRESEELFQHLHHRSSILLRHMNKLNMPVPSPLQSAAGFALNADLHEQLTRERPDAARIQALVDEARDLKVELDTARLEDALRGTLERLVARVAAGVGDSGRLERLDEVLDVADVLPFAVNPWKVQNVYYEVLKEKYPALVHQAGEGDPNAKHWADLFARVGEKLGVAVE